MTDPTNNSEDILKKLSRRNWLRNATITATGAVVLPSFLTSCTKEVQDLIKKNIPSGGLGSGKPLPPTLAQLRDAHDHINNLRHFIGHLYNETWKYDEDVFKALNSTVENESWAHFLYNLFIDIALAAAEAMPFLEEAMPAIGLVADFVKEWSEGTEKPSNLSGFFADYQEGHHEMGLAIDEKLSILVDVGDSNNPSYPNLKAAWNDTFVFRNENYTVSDLANTPFPTRDDNGTAYFKIWNPMYLHHKQSIWNLAIMKCCEIHRWYPWFVYPDNSSPGGEKIGGTAVAYGRRWYSKPENASSYLRGYKANNTIFYWFDAWDIGINGNPLPPAAAAILFKDDTPNHLINLNADGSPKLDRHGYPIGLFPRSYVFHQFNRTKPDFAPHGYQYHDLANSVYEDFTNINDQFEFTGGFFPELTE